MTTYSPFHVLIGFLLAAVFLLVLLWPTVRILRKAGYSGWWCLLSFVPLVNLVMLYIFAFGADWPNLTGRRDIRTFD